MNQTEYELQTKEADSTENGTELDICAETSKPSKKSPLAKLAAIALTAMAALQLFKIVDLCIHFSPELSTRG